MVWIPNNTHDGESTKCRWDLVPYMRGRMLDVGCGAFKVFPQAIGVDSGKEWGKAKADILVETAEKLDLFASQSVDCLFSSHLLEHIEDYKGALKEWWRVVKQGGFMVLYLPDEDEYPKVGEPGANIDHKWNVNYDKIIDAMNDVSGSWDLIEFEKRNKGDEYSLFFVFKKLYGKS